MAEQIIINVLGSFEEENDLDDPNEPDESQKSKKIASFV